MDKDVMMGIGIGNLLFGTTMILFDPVKSIAMILAAFAIGTLYLWAGYSEED